MHVLVTGGAGYIGSTLVPHLLGLGHRVTVLDRFYFGVEPLAPAIAKHGADLVLQRADVRRVTAADFSGVDAVVDLAGISNDPSCELDPELTRAINRDGSIRIAATAAAAGVRRLVFASSCSVYGHGESERLDESSPLNPVSLYARCKAEAEARVLAIGAEKGMTATALRFATVFGVSGRTRFDVAINVMTKNAYVDRRITVEGGGRQWRPFVHLRDVARAITNVLDQPSERAAGGVFNVGSDSNNLRILQLAYRVRDQIPGTEVVMAPTDPDLRDYNVSFARIERELAFIPEMTIDQGIAEVHSALRDGRIDPHDRRGYTLKQYVFLAEVERTFAALSLDGQVLS
ncbi:MAG: SDR family oxidoreductase [Polyangiaceae bacterium]|nr:SDR family oxidoreductase [Polyangiaceae bacterium]